MEQSNKSPHVFNTSANLFGLCFAVFSYLKALKLSGQTYIDEFTVVSMFMFLVSCSTSFMSMRSNSKRARIYETMADYIFMCGMFTLFLTTMFIVFKVML